MAWPADLRYGARSIRRNAPLSVGVVLTLVVGIGVNATVVSLFNGLLFRPAVTRDPSSFVQLYVELSGLWQRQLHGPPTLATLEDLATVRGATGTLAAVTASRWASFSLDHTAESLRGAFVSCDYLAANIGPMRAGRGLAGSDCAEPGREPVVVFTERGWQRYFERDPWILGRTVRVNNRPLTVIGIAPDDAVGPVAAMLYVPYTLQPVLQGPIDYFREPASRHAWLTISGRLRSGQTIGAAQAEIDVLTKALDRRHPGQSTRILVTNGAIIHEPETARSMPFLITLCLGATGAVLVLVCANVATLLLARAVGRRQEIAVRLALGASRGQVVRQLVTETAMLGGAAGIVGLVVAGYLPNHLAQQLTDFPLHQAFGPDSRVIALTLGLALLAGGVAGLSPAIESLRVGPIESLRDGGWTGSAGIRPRLSAALITNQLSMSLALLIVLAMIGRAQSRILDWRPAYDPATVIVASVGLAQAGYSGPSARAFYEKLVPAVEALPGVRAVAFASPPPFRGVSRRIVSTVGDGGDSQIVSSRAVSPGFFAMVGARLLEGRLFTETEARVAGQVMPVMVSNAFARRHFAGGSSLGRRIRIGENEQAEIVGVIADTTTVRAGEPDEPIVYQPLYTATVASLAPLVMIDPGATGVGELIRARVQMIDGRLTAKPETVMAPIARDMERYSALVRMAALPVTAALFLAVVSIYGLTRFTTAQRAHEIAIRVAYGARPVEVIRLFAASLLRPFVGGILGGSALAGVAVWGLRRSALALDLPPADPLALALAVSLLSVAALMATVIPALRAARNDPWDVLKQ